VIFAALAAKITRMSTSFLVQEIENTTRRLIDVLTLQNDKRLSNRLRRADQSDSIPKT